MSSPMSDGRTAPPRDAAAVEAGDSDVPPRAEADAAAMRKAKVPRRRKPRGAKAAEAGSPTTEAGDTAADTSPPREPRRKAARRTTAKSDPSPPLKEKEEKTAGAGTSTAARRRRKRGASAGPVPTNPVAAPDAAAGDAVAAPKPATPKPAERLPRYRALLRKLHELLPDRRARIERVSTAPAAALDGLSITGRNRRHGHDYRPSPRAVVGWALDVLQDRIETSTFVDIGSGRGRVVFEAAARPFVRVVGIEFAEDLHEDATLNLRHWPRALMRCRNVDFIRADAMEAPLPDGDLVVYMFDPFDDRLTLRMAARLAERARTSRVAVILVGMGNLTAFRESAAYTEIEPPRLAALRFALLSPYPVRLFSAQPR